MNKRKLLKLLVQKSYWGGESSSNGTMLLFRQFSIRVHFFSLVILGIFHAITVIFSKHEPSKPATMNFLINWSTSELNTQVNPTTCLGDTGCWIQQVTAPTLVVTCWIHQCTCILHSDWTGGASPPVQVRCKIHQHPRVFETPSSHSNFNPNSSSNLDSKLKNTKVFFHFSRA